MKILRNQRNLVGGAQLLASIPDVSASLVNLDPQYRTVLDKLAYGNEGARQIKRAKLPQMTDDDIVFFLSEAERVLKIGRHVMLWTDKYIAAEARHQQWLRRVPGLQVVELFVWNKVRPGMGKRGRCTTEFLFILQKPPIRAKGFWADRGITDCWHESSDSSRHPHAKPIALTIRLIRCLTKSRDLVVDPAAGGYGVLEACRATGREFLGGDLVEC